MKYQLAYDEIQIEVIETTLPEKLTVIHYVEELPDTLFLEVSLAQGEKVQTILRFFLEKMRQNPGKTTGF
jgi:hypothetical protein